MFLRLLSAALLLGGCAGDGRAPPPLLDASTGDATRVVPASLVLESEPTLTLGFGVVRSIDVSYRELDGRPVVGAEVRFALVGPANDSSIAPLAAFTGDDGRARTTLTTGGSPAVFQVRASAGRADPVRVDVAVSGAGFGDLLVTVSYRGERPLDERRVSVFPGARCDDEAVAERNAARVATIPPESSELRVFALPSETPYAVLVDGLGAEGATVATGCADGVEVAPGTATPVALLLEDAPLVLDGRYDATIELRTTAGAQIVGALRTAATRSIAEAGGEAPMLLDALVALLRESGSTDEADVLEARRSDGAMDLALGEVLSSGDMGPAAAVEALAMLVEERAGTFVVTGRLGIDTTPARPSEALAWTMTGVKLATTGASMQLALPRITPAVEMSATWHLDVLELRAVTLELDLPLGALASGVLDALAAEARYPSRAEHLISLRACARFEDFARSSLDVGLVCNDACVRRACAAALEDVFGPIDRAFTMLSERRTHVRVEGTLAMDDADANLSIDAITAEPAELRARWAPTGTGMAEVVDATFRATRVP